MASRLHVSTGMNISELMTPNPACCTPDTPIEQAARLMRQHDCGEIPVVDTPEGGALLGVVTDRDIVVRLVAEGQDVRSTTVSACMTRPAVSLGPDAQVSDAVEMMQAHQIRRIPIVDAQGGVCGIVAQADLARWSPSEQTGELVRDVSERTRPS
jgi:CBS domain-containing protein